METLERFAAIRPSKPRGIEGHNRKQDQEQAAILASFGESERRKIVHDLNLLSPICYFIGKDFDLPILLNTPGAGWYWNFKVNHVKVDPRALLEKPIGYLRWIFAHEAGHRRISRVDFIPKEIWEQPGFSFMMNAIEDPRDNNFVSDAYAKLKEDRDIAYSMERESKAEAKKLSKEKLGSTPRFMQAGYQYIEQWFNEVRGEPMVIDSSLPQEVQDVVRETLSAARDSWWRYPSKEEADRGEAVILKYAEASYRINLEKVWPSFKKLVDEDLKDERMRQAMEDMRKDGEGSESGREDEESKGESIEQAQQGKQSGTSQGKGAIPEKLKDSLTPSEQQELQEVLDAAAGENGKPASIDASQLSPELKKKLGEYVDALPEERKRELAERARKAFKELEDEINEALEGKLVDREHDTPAQRKHIDEDPAGRAPLRSTPLEDTAPVRDKLQELLEADRSEYNRVRQEMLPIIDRLEDDLREIFVERRSRAWEDGHKFGKRINLKRRIQEKAKGVSAVDSRAWEKREAPSEKDYAFSLLVDLSGSMRGGKITETFKAVVVLCEVLNKLSIKTEILGFNDRIHEFQDFNAPLSEDARESMGAMLGEVDSPRAQYNDDGWAVQQASARLARQDEAEKFLVVLSDGRPVESPSHATAEFDLERVVRRISQETDQKLIGLGIGAGTGHVEEYYPNNLANIPAAEMAEKLADLIREAIANYQDF